MSAKFFHLGSSTPGDRHIEHVEPKLSAAEAADNYDQLMDRAVEAVDAASGQQQARSRMGTYEMFQPRWHSPDAPSFIYPPPAHEVVQNKPNEPQVREEQRDDTNSADDSLAKLEADARAKLNDLGRAA